jgi:hypothetical protein
MSHNQHYIKINSSSDKPRVASKNKKKFDYKMLQELISVKNISIDLDELFTRVKKDRLNRETKIKGKCNSCRENDFEQTFRRLVENDSYFCIKCTEKRRITKIKEKLFKFDVDVWIQKAKEVHGDKYSYKKVLDYDFTGITNSDIKFPIICINCSEEDEKEYIFEQRSHDHLDGHGCSKCVGGVSYTTEQWKQKASKVHGNKYDYSKTLYTKGKENIEIICKVHGRFFQTASMHLQGYGCSKCSGKYNYTSDEWKEKAKEVHEGKFNYDKTNYTRSHERVTITCSEGHEFSQLPYIHLQRSGCSKCSGKYNYTSDEWKEKAKEVHEGKFNYDKTNYTRSHERVTITCLDHGDFQQLPYHHLRGHGCINCIDTRVSKVQIEWLNFLEYETKLTIEHAKNTGEHKIKDSRYLADGYNEQHNIVFEFNGCYYHGCPNCFERDDLNTKTKKTFGELYEKTQIKQEYVINKGYKYIEIWECDWNEIKISTELKNIYINNIINY